MLDALKRHPFPVVARFERVLAVSFAFPREVLEPLLPPPLELDSRNGLGFLAVALVWTRSLRPAGLPAAFGRDFFLAGYRVFARARDRDGRRLRGLRILRSETDRRLMVLSGNLLTRYNYRRIRLHQSPGRIRTTLPDGRPTLELGYELGGEAAIPGGSPFPDWRSARRFAGPMPFTFDLDATGRIVVIEGRRASWSPRPFRVNSWHVSLFDAPPLRGIPPVLANAFAVHDVDYRWEKGRILAASRHPDASPA